MIPWKIISVLGDNGDFGYGGISMSIWHFPIRMYNKDKSKTFGVDFFILSNSKYHFFYNIDVYQG